MDILSKVQSILDSALLETKNIKSFHLIKVNTSGSQNDDPYVVYSLVSSTIKYADGKPFIQKYNIDVNLHYTKATQDYIDELLTIIKKSFLDNDFTLVNPERDIYDNLAKICGKNIEVGYTGGL